MRLAGIWAQNCAERPISDPLIAKNRRCGSPVSLPQADRHCYSCGFFRTAALLPTSSSTFHTSATCHSNSLPRLGRLRETPVKFVLHCPWALVISDSSLGPGVPQRSNVLETGPG